MEQYFPSLRTWEIQWSDSDNNCFSEHLMCPITIKVVKKFSFTFQESQDSYILPQSLQINCYETYGYSSQMESDRESLISQGCRVITLGQDGTQQLVYAHPSHPTALHLFLNFCIIHWFKRWRWRICCVWWIQDANLFDTTRICPGIYHLVQHMHRQCTPIVKLQ